MSQEDTDRNQPILPVVSRRTFLKGAGAVALGTTAAFIFRRFGLDNNQPNPKTPEAALTPELESVSSVLVLDFFDLNRFSPDNETALKKMGVQDPSTTKGLQYGVPQNEDQVRAIAQEFLKVTYATHGIQVVDVMRKTKDLIEPNKPITTLRQISIVDAVSIGEIQLDKIGNPTASVKISEEGVDTFVSQSTEGVVNISFELGNFPFVSILYGSRLKHPEMARQYPSIRTVGETTGYTDYQGNTITADEYNKTLIMLNETEIGLLNPKDRETVFLDGYTGTETYENLRKLVTICKKYPGKMFVAAAGNPTKIQGFKMPDIREARETMVSQGEWPDNLLICGFKVFDFSSGVGSYTGVASYGADIYVSGEDLKSLGFDQASSFATPVITEIVRQIKERGITSTVAVKETLMHMADEEEGVVVGPTGESFAYNVLNLQKAKEVLGTLHTP